LLAFSHKIFYTEEENKRRSEDSMDPVGRAIGEIIRFYRARQDVTQEQLAKRAGIAPTSVVRLENGEVGRPRVTTLHKVAGALEIDPGELTSFLLRNPATEPEPLEVSNVGPFTAVFQRDGNWWIGYVEELPGANAQERTLKEARESLVEAIRDVLEANRELTRTEFEDRDVVRETIRVPG
jgi:transcriptional regulator with XRE-family HTH domain